MPSRIQLIGESHNNFEVDGARCRTALKGLSHDATISIWSGTSSSQTDPEQRSAGAAREIKRWTHEATFDAHGRFSKSKLRFNAIVVDEKTGHAFRTAGIVSSSTASTVEASAFSNISTSNAVYPECHERRAGRC
jgi:hypothetical protein